MKVIEPIYIAGYLMLQLLYDTFIDLFFPRR